MPVTSMFRGYLHDEERYRKCFVRALKGRPVRFRFRLENGKLFAFWVSPDETGASYGYVAGGGPGYETRIDDQGLKAYPK